eukprot:m.81891 g.81891  ORF g.81891 m.81891 type:complete len:225 (-) comp14706_c0_seq4:69-743(-)
MAATLTAAAYDAADMFEDSTGRDYAARLAAYLCEWCAVWSRPALSSSWRTAGASFNNARVVWRLFDSLPCAFKLSLVGADGLGLAEPDPVLKWSKVAESLADLAYLPMEHLAWLADVQLLPARAAGPLWHSTSLVWALSLLSAIVGEVRNLHLNLNRFSPQEMTDKALKIAALAADFVNAIHWGPRGLLWAGRNPPLVVAVFGIFSSWVKLRKILSDKRQFQTA